MVTDREERRARRLLACKRVVVLIVAMLFAAFGGLVFMSFGPDAIRSFSRRHESLPTAMIESDGTVYCRMPMRDFRFPLPRGALLESVFVAHGGADFIDGSVFIHAGEGTSLDMRTYAELLERSGFHIEREPGRCDTDVASFTAQSNDELARVEVSVDKDNKGNIQF